MKEVDYRRFIGRNLTMAREALGVQQIALATEYGIGQSRLSQWERGIYYPDPWFLFRLCLDHGFTMDWFYRGIPAGVGASLAGDLRRVRAETE